MWQLSIILTLVFIGLAWTLFILFHRGIQNWQRYEKSMADTIDYRMSGLFMFADSKKIVVWYLMLLVGIPAALLLFKISIFIVLVVALLVWILPIIVLSRLEHFRRKKISESLPSTLSQMAAAMKSGATLSSAIEATVAENTGPLGQEFSLLLRQQKLGMKLGDALDNLAERVRSEEMDLVVAAAMIAQEVGGNLSEIFQRLSETLRKKLEMERKIKALTAQGVLQGWIVGLLPFGILAVIGFLEPDAAKPILTSVLGWVCLATIIFLELLGGLMIKKIVSIDI